MAHELAGACMRCAHGPRPAPSVHDPSKRDQTGRAATRVSPARWHQQQRHAMPWPTDTRAPHPTPTCACRPEATGIARNLAPDLLVHLPGPTCRLGPGRTPTRPPCSPSQGPTCHRWLGDVSWMARAAGGRLDECTLRMKTVPVEKMS